jgi:hypothetical protein
LAANCDPHPKKPRRFFGSGGTLVHWTNVYSAYDPIRGRLKEALGEVGEQEKGVSNGITSPKNA